MRNAAGEKTSRFAPIEWRSASTMRDSGQVPKTELKRPGDHSNDCGSSFDSRPKPSCHHLFQANRKPAVDGTGIGYPRSLPAFSLDPHTELVLYNSHCCALPPPPVHLAWSRDPHSPFLPQFGQMGKQRLVNFPLRAASRVVGMNDEAKQTMALHNEFNLGLPQVGP